MDFQHIIESYEKQLLNEINTNVNLYKHNHPPVPYKVHGCAYCDAFGNIFENQTVKFDKQQIDLLTKHISQLKHVSPT